MLLPARTLSAIADGLVDLAFRRWERPRVRAGGSQRTAIGVIGFDAVEVVSREALTDAAAARAGFASRAELLGFLDRKPAGDIYRIGLRLVGPDPRIALREQQPDGEEHEAIASRLARLDALSRHGAWTRSVLVAIRDHPGVPAVELAAAFDREKLPFKQDVRKLKELGLTESLRPGYRLSARGRAVVERLEGRG